jgi:XTP/dITP diphosphohydrolase
MRLLLATSNHGKIKEMQDLLKGLDLQVVSPPELGLELDVVEDGATYQENASRKALAFAHLSGLAALADDSGLEVDALGGGPGLYSHRFAPQPQATDADRRKYLLQQLRNHPRPWLARFRCLVAVATPAGEVQFAEGVCPGEIIPEERGNDGFGYDPIFLLPGLGRTMAELSLEEKNRISHRARAVRAAYPILQDKIKQI